MNPPNSSAFDAELLGKIEGVQLSVGYHNPFLINDPGQIWLVLNGSVDLFAVPLVEGQMAGVGTHLLRVNAGALIFGMPTFADPAATSAGGHAEIGLRAVATMGTQLFRARRSDIEKDDFDIIVVDWIDRWISQLAEVIAPAGGPRSTGFLEADPQVPVAAGAILVPQRGDVIWTRLDAGAAQINDQWPVTPGDPDWPMTGNLWLTCPGDSTVSAVYTPTALFRGVLWNHLDAFHHRVMQVIAGQGQQTRQAAGTRLERQAQASRLAFSGALRQLSAILTPTQSDQGEAAATPEDPLYAAVCLVGAAAGVTVAPPAPGRSATRLHPLAEIARRSHFRTRRVVLLGDWHRQDNGPLLAYRAADRQPVALLPDGPQRYRLVDPITGQQQPVTTAVADTLSGEAHLLYRHFPAQPLRIRDVLAFGLHGLRRDFVTLMVMGVLTSLVALATPIATGQLFASVIPRADLGMHGMIIAGLTLAALGTAAFTITRSFALLRIQTRMDAGIQTAVWDRLLTLPAPFFRDYSSGDLADRANGVNTIREALSNTAIQAVINCVFSLSSLLLLFWYSARLAFIALGIVLVMLGLSLLLTRLQLPLQREMIRRSGLIEGLVFQLLTGLAKLRLSASEPRAFARWADRFGVTKDLTYRIRRLAALQSVLTALFPLLASIILFAAIHWLLQSGGAAGFGIGEFMSFNAAFGQFSAAMIALLGALTVLISIVPLYERVRPILETLPEVSDLKADPGSIDGRIEFSNIVFHYDPAAPPIISDVSLRIDSGSYVAFVGASGSGKSTLVRLLLGFERPAAGGVYIDGKDLSGLDMQAVRRQIGVVLQNGRIMAGTIFDNIIGSLPLTLEDAWEAAHMAGFADDVRAMPMGMHTVLSEGAGALSGGQRQRLMIARALAPKPRILILDEATSALDNRTQERVNHSLARMNMTRLVVAHRLSTIQNVDRIFVMRQGRIVEEGNFASLMAKNGEFAELARRQMV